MNRRNLIVGIVLAACVISTVIVIYRNTGTLWHNQYDDSYITYRYAINLADGHGLVFNVGERADAASSFLYTMTLAAFHRVGWRDMEMVSFLLNMLAVGLIAFFVYLCALRLSWSLIVAVALGMLASLHGFISGWAVLGMDTVPFTALLCALAWAVIERHDKLSFALVFASCLMRPEGLLIVPFWWLAMECEPRRGALIAGLVVIYYTARFAYYGTILPHSYLAKNILLYYQSAPRDVVVIWKAFALIAPFIALVGAVLDRHVRWLGVYIALAGVSCLLGPRSDWCRYAAPLLPLCLIAGAPILRRLDFALIVCTVLTVQGWDSVQWMNRNAANLAPVQNARSEVGDWLREHADRSRPVISGDIGAIAYRARDVKFIDMSGLTSPDVAQVYRNGRNADKIIRSKHPAYVADTFEIKDKKLVYTHGNGSFVRGGKPSNILPTRLMWGKQFGQSMAIAIGELQ